MRRRGFITLLGGAAAAWPLMARAQKVPVVGFLHSQSAEGLVEVVRGFRLGLKDAGYVEGETVAIEYRWAENKMERLPDLAADLARRQVAVIAAMDSGSSLPAKAATTTIPIVFLVGGDPVKHGLVASLARPGGNLTGTNFFTSELVAKRLELLRELVPTATRVGVLVNPAYAEVTESTVRDAHMAAHAMGLQVRVLEADTNEAINALFAGLARERLDALFVGPGPFFTSRRVQLTQWTARHALPTIYSQRLSVEAGGLISYGASLGDTARQVGIYVGRILKGASPADLPVIQSTKFELVINIQTARMLGLTVPPTLLARADGVIE
jgi:putative tryptophan/tyrosine transport system substrate-binding protein